MRLKNIICATDFSEPSKHAADYGVALAKEFSARLYMCHVIDMSYAAMYGECKDPVELEERIMRQANESLRSSIGEDPLDWEPRISKGHTSDEINRMATDIGVDLAITATHGRSGLKRWILGSVTERLIRTLPCPLLVVRSPEHDFVSPGSQKVKLDRILVGCDFSPDSNLSFQYALALARQFQCELHLAHVIESTIYKHILKSGPERGQDQHALFKELDEKLKNMIPGEAHACCAPRTELLAGQPYEELTKYAVTHNIDLIVLGVRGHSLMETLFLGSTTDRVVRQAPCPVLSVRPTGSHPQE
jgi:nucleotide-binding universal stress UspA family protein